MVLKLIFRGIIAYENIRNIKFLQTVIYLTGSIL